MVAILDHWRTRAGLRGDWDTCRFPWVDLFCPCRIDGVRRHLALYPTTPPNNLISGVVLLPCLETYSVVQVTPNKATASVSSNKTTASVSSNKATASVSSAVPASTPPVVVDMTISPQKPAPDTQCKTCASKDDGRQVLSSTHSSMCAHTLLCPGGLSTSDWMCHHGRFVIYYCRTNHNFNSICKVLLHLPIRV